MEKELFDDLVQSLQEAKEIKQGSAKPSRKFTIHTPDAKKVREKVGLSQRDFAELVGVSIDTIQNWEQRRRNPSGPAAALLRIVDSAPDIAYKAIKTHGERVSR